MGTLGRRELPASTASVSRLEHGSLKIRSLLSVGTLGPEEERCPQDETYEITTFPNLATVLEDQHTWTSSLANPATPDVEKEQVRQFGKASSMGSTDRRGRSAVGLAGRVQPSGRQPGGAGRRRRVQSRSSSGTSRHRSWRSPSV